MERQSESDPEIIDRLRRLTTSYKRYASSDTAAAAATTTEMVVMEPRLASSLLLQYPSELPPCFVVAVLLRWATTTPALPPTKEKSIWQLTPRGAWKDRRGSYTAVCSGVDVDSSPAAPRYVGVKRVLQFHHRDGHGGADTGWRMVLYHALDCFSVIEDKITLCKVLFQPKGDRDLSKRDKKFAAGKQSDGLGASSSSSPATLAPPTSAYLPPTFFDECDKMMNDFNAEEHPRYGDMQMDDMFLPSQDDDDTQSTLAGHEVVAQSFTNYKCFNNGEEEEEEEEEAVPLPLPVAVSDGGRRLQMKRKRSQAWEHFTMIRTREHPEEDVYAACHLCDCLLKAHGRRDGTSTLNNHYRNHLKRKAS